MFVSENAKSQILKNSKFLVILVEVGGCKGLIYEYFYSNDINNYIVLLDLILTDEVSLPFLLDASLDFMNDIGYSDFQITNNQLVSFCGCGKSFQKSN